MYSNMLSEMIFGVSQGTPPTKRTNRKNLRGTVGGSDMDVLRVPAPKQSALEMLYESLSAHALKGPLIRRPGL